MRVLIADMDGTVVDSMAFLQELAVALGAADDHNEQRMRELYRETIGMPIADQFMEWNRRYGSKDDGIQIVKMARLYGKVHALAAPNFPLTDFGRSLRDYRGTEWVFALVSSTHPSIIQGMPQLSTIKWRYVGGYSGPGTEKSIQILRCVQKLGVALDQTVYVGDADSDRHIAESLQIPYYYPNANTLTEISNAVALAAVPKVHQG